MCEHDEDSTLPGAAAIHSRHPHLADKYFSFCPPHLRPWWLDDDWCAWHSDEELAQLADHLMRLADRPLW
jgi:hypothetical protein